MARRSVDNSKQIVVSVVGVSGGEREKGVTGVGKSCLCNRFIRPQADNYHVDHISVLSQTDFSGRVVNNDHFLYWGKCSKTVDDGTDYAFDVIEQTEFIDDASFMPFKAGKMDPYIKRCCATKIQSAEKLMYICKNQLGIEKEYEQKVLPDGKLNVDGFLCVFDVSQVPNRSLDRMVEMTAAIISNCVKTKRPVVLVTTKNDEANEIYVKEAEKLCCRKEFKGNIPLIESSSHECVNVESAFLTLAQLVDRNRGKIRIVPYFEAARHRKDVLDMATDIYHRLLRNVVSDYRIPWAVASKKLSPHRDFGYYVDLFGMDSAARLYRRYAKKLKDDFLQRKVEGYMEILPSILREFFPDLQSLEDGDWLFIQQQINDHPEFDRYFLRCYEDDLPWTENIDLLDSSDPRIPFDVLDTNEAENVFKNHVNALEEELEMREMRDRFKMLLFETGYVTPGKRLDEVRVLFMGRESFDSLPEPDRQIIYDIHQKEITEKARKNFVELLWEHSELYDHVKSLSPSGTISQDVREITQTLQEDSRYKNLDRLENERTLLLLQHLGFIHCPKKERCPSYPSCVDVLVETIFAQKSSSNSRPSSDSWGSKGIEFSESMPSATKVNLAVVGLGGIAQELHEVLKHVCEDDEFEISSQIFSLDYRVINGDSSLPLRTPDYSPTCVFCAYHDVESLKFLGESLGKFHTAQLENQESSVQPPIAILFVPAPQFSIETASRIREDGAALAQSLQGMFVEVSHVIGASQEVKFDFSEVKTALHSLLHPIHRRTQPRPSLNSSANSVRVDSPPDIRIIMCLFCGDPYSIDNVLSPLLNHQWSTVTGERSIALQTFLDESKRKVEVVVSSFHGVDSFKDDLVHGFILVYSTKRKASLSVLRAFSASIPNLPIQVLAVTDSTSASCFFGSDISQQLITEGNNIADRLQAHFMTLSSSSQQKSAFYTPFFKEVWEKKAEIEQAFNMEDPSGLDDSGEGTLERPRQAVLRGLGFPAFSRKSNQRSHSVEGSSSEIYEAVPTDGSLGDGLDEPLSPRFAPSDPQFTPSDDSDIYSHIDNDEEEHLVKPSQFKKHHNRFNKGWVDDNLPSRRLEEYWPDSNYGPHLFTMGRRSKLPPPPPARPKPKTSQTLKQPGKLNLKDFSSVTDTLSRISMKDGSLPPVKLTKGEHVHAAPLATPENMNLNTTSEYASVKDVIQGHYFDTNFGYTRVSDIPLAASAKARQRQRRERGRQAYSDSDSDWSSPERRRSSDSSKSGRKTAPKRTKKKRIPIPVATPRVPSMSFYSGEGGGSGGPLGTSHRKSEERLLLDSSENKGKVEGEAFYRILPEDDSSIEVSSPRDPQQSPLVASSQLTSRKDADKTGRRKDKQRSKEEAKLKEEEKKKTKEEEKLKKEKERERKKALKSSGKAQSSKGASEPSLEDFAQGPDRPVPLFVRKCVEFIEAEGLDSEGIYRVPGNKMHVEQLMSWFKEDNEVSFADLDIPVNAAATALKDHLKQLPPLLPQDKMEELTSIAGYSDRSCRLLKLKEMLTSLPSVNFEIFKFIFHHFVRVAENCKLNSMDSKNLAICWWPTLLHTLQFTDIGAFESQRPHIEDIIQTMIDQFPFLFQGKEDYVMV